MDDSLHLSRKVINRYASQSNAFSGTCVFAFDCVLCFHYAATGRPHIRRFHRATHRNGSRFSAVVLHCRTIDVDLFGNCNFVRVRVTHKESCGISKRRAFGVQPDIRFNGRNFESAKLRCHFCVDDVTKLPKAEHDADEWQAAMEAIAGAG